MRNICSDKELVPLLCEKLGEACRSPDEGQCEQAMFRVCSLLINLKGKNDSTI